MWWEYWNSTFASSMCAFSSLYFQQPPKDSVRKDLYLKIEFEPIAHEGNNLQLALIWQRIRITVLARIEK
jgi:hypothetical protein